MWLNKLLTVCLATGFNIVPKCTASLFIHVKIPIAYMYKLIISYRYELKVTVREYSDK